ncbi:MAG: hypothetical protein AB7O93_12345 [Vicinamibacterales bacterium]
MTALRHASAAVGLTALLWGGSCTSPESSPPERQPAAASEHGSIPETLSEATRKQIYSDGFAGEHRAMREANAKYPVDYSKPDALQQVKTKGEYERALIEAYDLELMKRHGISEQQYRAIIEEGVAKKWAKPSFQE